MPSFAPYKSIHDVSRIELGVETKIKNDQRYNALRDLDDLSDSSTEAGEWEVEDGMKLQRSGKRRFWRVLSHYRWLLDTTLLLVIVGLLAEKRWRRDHSYQYEFAGDITGFAPKFSQQIVTFRPNPIFAPENASEFWNRDVQQAWLNIVPEGLGYVEVKDSAQHDNLPRPIHDYVNNTVFTTSMTHQLHCLYTILNAYNTMSVTLDNPMLKVNPIQQPWHVNHCFEYIRQAIMCAGDVALEGAATTFPLGPNGEDQGGSDGWDGKHVCKDYGQIIKYLEKETINHVRWIS
ncbi:uncharacterized protein EKO05_0004751 [Ascochyta rabiei]|uniref:Uncharacterized protein n=1 Tax=Didymella rabiei TaxID=5454 RepID=A0A163KFU5_DIDRA|nr:uncharacterized protein EKO05_0004751 [Ascochyta rabiei]KZM26970.1 hypothetical protein ST47_g1891 [Ascochyta rabiei]UPX14262.1 hypothetical protein EKO05_0004751 [Ascochyta rabiei]